MPTSTYSLSSSIASGTSSDSSDIGFWPPYDGPLCKVCFCFDWDRLERRPMNGGKCSTLIRSARDGCYTCGILKTSILSFFNVRNPPRTRFGFTVRTFGSKSYESDGGEGDVRLYPDFKVWEIDAGKVADGIDLYKRAGKTLSSIRIATRRTVMPRSLFLPDEPCPWRFLEEKHHLPESTASPASYAWGQAQLQKCLAEHEECGADSDNPLMPTRVLDVGLGESASDDSRNGVRVFETNGLRGRYLALSHCWGDPALMPTKLTAHTLGQYRVQIPFDSLPRTFKHAVLAARRLKVRYLWIDSLCIIQSDDRDSPQDRELSRRDWEYESSRMCSVYQNSYLTLAGVSSSGCTDGLFFQSKRIEMKGSNIDGPYLIYARKEINHHAQVFPLLKRGWVTQESLLSPRTLFCGEQELLWHCRGSRACQCSTAFTRDDSNYVKLPKIGQLKMKATYSELVKMWYSLICNYSVTTLTYQTDRLAAIDGIADYMRPLRNGEYLGGLWADSLAFDLLWSIDTFARSSKRIRQVEPCLDTPWASAKWLFPTWSWASIEGRVSWQWIKPHVQDCPPEAILVKRMEQSETSSQDPPPAYQLKLRGVLVPSTLEVVATALNRTTTYYPDFEGQFSHLQGDKKVHCLRVLQSGDSYYSLVLLCVDEYKNVYERLGVLMFTDTGHGVHSLPDMREGFVSWPRPLVQGLPPWWEVHKGWQGEQVNLTLV